MRCRSGLWFGDPRPARVGRLLPCLLVLLATLPALAAGVDGQVFDGEGQPLRGVVVRIVQAPPAPLFPRRDGETPREVEISRATTDSGGFFHLDLGGWVPRGRILLRVGDLGPWDVLRYARPAPRDLTADIRRRGSATVAVRVADAPGWPDLRAALERVGGAGTPLGRLLRRYGFPRTIVADASGRLEYDFGTVHHVVRAGAADGRGDRPRPASRRGGGER